MNVSEKSMRTPLARARGLGSAKDGVHHWWMQRLTAIVLALLTPWFLWQMLCVVEVLRRDVIGPSYEMVLRQVLGEPRHALPLLAFMLALFWHAKLGLQVVIEDYVHTRWLEVALQVINSLACASGALLAVVGIVRMWVMG